MKPVKNWRDAWKWFSVQAMAIAGAIQGVWIALPDDMKASIPVDYVTYATMAAVAFGVIGRVIDQGGNNA